MKKKLFLLMATLMALGQGAFAYDFSAVAPSGDTLYYTIIDSVNHYVKTTYPNDVELPENGGGTRNLQTLWGPHSYPSGSLVIPDSVSYNGIKYIVKAIGGSSFRGCPLTSVSMPNTIDSIGKDAFASCSYLADVSVSNSLRDIGVGAFGGCSIGEFICPPSLKIIREKAFQYANITSITLNDSLETIDAAAFTYTPLLTLYIPASVRNINRAICNGTTLSCIVVDPNNPYFDSRDNCNAIINYMGVLMQGCKNTIIPEGTTDIYNSAFEGCNLGTVVLPSSVRRINFTWTHINRIVISSPYLSINTSLNCDTLQFIIEEPPIPLAEPIDGWNGLNKYVIVPCNSLAAYQADPYWSRFTNMHELGVPDIVVNADENGTATILNAPSCGHDTAIVGATATEEHYHFSHWSDGSTQNPYTVALNGNTTLTAYFALDNMTVTAIPANPYKGMVLGGGQVPYGDTTTLTAVPMGNNIFLSWDNGVAANPYTLSVTSDTTVRALFTLPDTIFFYDTVNHYLHDTTFVHDYVHDTMIQYVNWYIHDTAYVQDYVHDTVIQYMNHYMHDTLYVHDYVHDTTIQYVNQYVHDTAFVNQYVHDTVMMSALMYDTTIVNIYQYDTSIYNTYHFDTLIINNQYYDTVFVHVHDTVYITVEGIGGVDAINAKVYSSQGQIVVEGADGNSVTMYDVTGRILATRQDNYMPLRFDAPVSGTYLIKIGNYPARRVVVVR